MGQSVYYITPVAISVSGTNTTGTLALVNSGSLYLAGGANITLSQNGQSISISGGAGGGGGWELSAGASTQSSGTIIFSNANNVSFGLSTAAAAAGTLTASVPATSSLVGAGGITMSTAGSTITISNSALTRYITPFPILTAVSAPGNASLTVRYVPLDVPLTGTQD